MSVQTKKITNRKMTKNEFSKFFQDLSGPAERLPEGIELRPDSAFCFCTKRERERLADVQTDSRKKF